MAPHRSHPLRDKDLGLDELYLLKTPLDEKLDFVVEKLFKFLYNCFFLMAP